MPSEPAQDRIAFILREGGSAFESPPDLPPDFLAATDAEGVTQLLAYLLRNSPAWEELAEHERRRLLKALRDRGSEGGTCEELSAAAEASDDVEHAFMILERLASSPYRGVVRTPRESPFEAMYRFDPEGARASGGGES